jgi:hypothetical protein
MHITRIELEDIKSYVNAAFDFERGHDARSWARTGPGRRRSIEAVAWTLFDVLDYRKKISSAAEPSAVRSA